MRIGLILVSCISLLKTILSSANAYVDNFLINLKNDINEQREKLNLPQLYYDYMLHTKLQDYRISNRQELLKNYRVIEFDSWFGRNRPKFLLDGDITTDLRVRKGVRQYFKQIPTCLDFSRCSNTSFSHFVSCAREGIDIHKEPCDKAPFRAPMLLIKSLKSFAVVQVPTDNGIGKFFLYGDYDRIGMDMLLRTDQFWTQ